MTITCGIQSTGVVTMAMKALHNTCNMCIHDLLDMNSFSPWACSPQAFIRGHVATITYVPSFFDF